MNLILPISLILIPTLFSSCARSTIDDGTDAQVRTGACQPNPCSQSCIAPLGVPECRCSIGYTLNADGTTCDDADGCLQHTCAAIDTTATCIDAAAPEVGSSCLCSPGYTDYSGTCTSIKSCDDILAKVPNSPDGIYTVDADGPGGLPPFSVVCDMTTDGGGWTKILYLVDKTYTINTEAFGNFEDLTNDAKLSDAQINALNSQAPSGNSHYRIKGDLTNLFAYILSNGTYQDNAPGFGFGVPAQHTVQSCIADSFANCTYQSPSTTSDWDQTWMDQLYYGTGSGETCARYFTGHIRDGVHRHCYPSTTTDRCINGGSQCNNRAPHNTVDIWLRAR